jgi:hypothetical protein
MHNDNYFAFGTIVNKSRAFSISLKGTSTIPRITINMRRQEPNNECGVYFNKITEVVRKGPEWVTGSKSVCGISNEIKESNKRVVDPKANMTLQIIEMGLVRRHGEGG